MIPQKYFFNGSYQPKKWYGLISPSLDRLYLLSNEYRYLKLLQLCIMRSELFYIIDLSQLTHDPSIDNSNCLVYTLSNARRLHLELDVELKKLKSQSLIKKDSLPKATDLELQNKLFISYQVIKMLEERYREYTEILINDWQQEIKGLEIARDFVSDVFDDQDFNKIANRDAQELSFAIGEIKEFRKKILQALTFIDYDQPIQDFKNSLQKNIQEIDLGKYSLEVRKIQSTNKKLDMNLCERLISQSNYHIAQQVLKEKLSTSLLLLLK